MNVILIGLGFAFIVVSCMTIYVRRYLARRMIQQRVAATLIAFSKGVSADLIDRYLVALREHGVDSPNAKALRQGNKNNADFMDFCGAIDNTERKLGL